MRNRFSINCIGFVLVLGVCGCATSLPFEGEPMPPNQVTAFMKVVTPATQYDEPPRFVSGFAPFFPDRLTAKGFWGYTEIHFAVQTDGSTADIRLIDATAPDFARVAAIAVQKWKFTPAMKNGRPVRVRVRLPFTFRS